MLIRFETWANETASSLRNPKHQRAFDSFTRWRHLRQLREQDRPVTEQQNSGRRQELRHVVGLLEWLTDRGESINNLDQHRLDLWLAPAPGYRRRVKQFLDWASRNRLCPRLTLPPQQSTHLALGGATAAERWELLEASITQEHIDPRTRLAGALVLLYGIRPVRLRTLEIADIIERDSDVLIRLGADPLELPPTIARIALAARDHRRAPRLLSDDGETRWLFPGQRHGEPISVDALTDRLRILGIRSAHARAGALTELAQTLPAPIIARLTGMNVVVATRWADAVSASHARYTTPFE